MGSAGQQTAAAAFFATKRQHQQQGLFETFTFYVWYKYWHLKIEGLLVKPQAMPSPRTPDTPTDEKKRETVR